MYNVNENLKEFLSADCFLDFISSIQGSRNEERWDKAYKSRIGEVEDGIEEIGNDELHRMLSRTHLLILTATRTEIEAMHYELSRMNVIRCKIYKNPLMYYFADLEHYNIVYLCAGDIGSGTKYGSHQTLQSVFSEYTPKLVFSVGVGFGMYPNTQSIGDVLVSSRVLSYNESTKLKDGGFMIKKPQTFDTCNDLLSRLCRRFSIQSDNEISIQIGNIVTGASVVDDSQVKKNILIEARKHGYSKGNNNEILGGEMEGWGLYDECTVRQVPCAIIKGICDWGEGKNALNTLLEDEDLREKVAPLIGGIENEERINDAIKDCMQTYAAIKAIKAFIHLTNDSFLLTGIVFSEHSISAIRQQDRVVNWYMTMVDRIRSVSVLIEIAIVSFMVFGLIATLAFRETIDNIMGNYVFGNKKFAIIILGFINLILIIRGAVLSRVMKWLRRYSAFEYPKQSKIAKIQRPTFIGLFSIVAALITIIAAIISMFGLYVIPVT